jgi:hypothetical protein
MGDREILKRLEILPEHDHRTSIHPPRLDRRPRRNHGRSVEHPVVVQRKQQLYRGQWRQNHWRQGVRSRRRDGEAVGRKPAIQPHHRSPNNQHVFQQAVGGVQPARRAAAPPQRIRDIQRTGVCQCQGRAGQTYQQVQANGRPRRPRSKPRPQPQPQVLRTPPQVLLRHCIPGRGPLRQKPRVEHQSWPAMHTRPQEALLGAGAARFDNGHALYQLGPRCPRHTPPVLEPVVAAGPFQSRGRQTDRALPRVIQPVRVPYI